MPRKPLLNLPDVGFDGIEDQGHHTSHRGQIGVRIGAQQRGDPLSGQPPGKARRPDAGKIPGAADAAPRLHSVMRAEHEVDDDDHERLEPPPRGA